MIYASVYLLSALGISLMVTVGYFAIFFFIIGIVGYLIALLLSVVIRFLTFEV